MTLLADLLDANGIFWIEGGQATDLSLEELLRRPAWQADALCREHPEIDFFPDKSAPVGPAVRHLPPMPRPRRMRSHCARTGEPAPRRVGRDDTEQSTDATEGDQGRVALVRTPGRRQRHDEGTVAGMEQEKALDWARKEIDRLRGLQPGNEVGREFRHVGAGTVTFLRQQAPGSGFVEAAERALDQDYAISLTRGLISALDQWCYYVETGMAAAQPFEVRARIEAATDLMEQVQLLLDDSNVIPAASVMLAGAALEEFLRSLLVGCSEPVVGKPGLSSYSAALQKGRILDRQDAKDITAWAGKRNAAAHGEFEKLDDLGARIMVDGINHFLRKKSSPQR